MKMNNLPMSIIGKAPLFLSLSRSNVAKLRVIPELTLTLCNSCSTDNLRQAAVSSAKDDGSDCTL